MSCRAVALLGLVGALRFAEGFVPHIRTVPSEKAHGLGTAPVHGARLVSELSMATGSPAINTATKQELLTTVTELSTQVEQLSAIVQGLRTSAPVPASPASQATVKQMAPATPVASAAKPGKATKDKPLVWAISEPASPEWIQQATLTFLEAKPHWDQTSIPLNTYKPKEPFTGTIELVERLVAPNAPGDVFHVKIRHDGQVAYWEGQSISIIPEGVDASGKPHKARLYSIASTRYGDDGDGQTVSFCVRRAAYVDPETGKEDPAKQGVCSNFLAKATQGQKVRIAGPSGKIMLLPEAAPETDIIMVGTGTGIAPYRGFIERLFREDTYAARAFTGLAWLFLGVANTDMLLYHEDFMGTVRRYPFNFRYDLALSREQKNRAGGKMYIQDKMEEYADELFDRLDNGAHIYFCGLKGMMPGINTMLERVATSKGIKWDEKLGQLKKNGQWHVEVY